MEALERLVKQYIANLLKASSSHNVDMSDGIKSDQAIIETGFAEAGLPARSDVSHSRPYLPAHLPTLHLCPPSQLSPLTT